MEDALVDFGSLSVQDLKDNVEKIRCVSYKIHSKLQNLPSNLVFNISQNILNLYPFISRYIYLY